MAIDQPLTQEELERLLRESSRTQTLTGASALQARLLYDIALRLKAIGVPTATGAEVQATETPTVAQIAGPVPTVAAPPASAPASARSEAIELSELLRSTQTLVASLQQARDDQARHKLELLDDLARIVRAEAQGSLNTVLEGIRGSVKLSVAEIMGVIAGLQRACECRAACGAVNVIVSDIQRSNDVNLETIKANQAAIAELRCSLDEAVKRCGELKDTVSTLCEFRDWAKPAIDEAQTDSYSALEESESAQESYNNFVSQFSGVSKALASMQDGCVQQTLRSNDHQVSIDRARADTAALSITIEKRCGELSGRCDAIEAAMLKPAGRNQGESETHQAGVRHKKNT